ncbi:serine/threonine protein kinase [Candidatus Magnetoovum chiemensis]|nr:serine/threonine protein kinase [Candidatus Magnetoovum chiemensis]
MKTQSWEIGDVIMDLYEVLEVFKSGGMGLVCRIRHRGWNVDLAMKSPRPEFFKTEAQKKNFETEAQTWINLGLHPNVTSCYYVRRINDVPHVFAEYIDGGSLQQWITGGKLSDIEKILDMAIQFANGLQYSHEQGLVHQDVKPANVMVTKEGIAKVTDFGLSKASSVSPNETQDTPKKGVKTLVSSGGMTPAYCSPEQAMKKPLSIKTDIWSWGLSILEMFIGKVTWMIGTVAADILDGYLKYGSQIPSMPQMPKPLINLLRSCFELDENKRPLDMAEIINTLKDIYYSVTKQEYARPEYTAGRATADSLNNRAISLLDLGMTEDAERLWSEALRSDPNHVESNFNLSVYEWKKTNISQQDIYKKMEEALKVEGASERDFALLAKLYIFFGDYSKAVEIYRKFSSNLKDWAKSELKDFSLALCASGKKTEDSQPDDSKTQNTLWKEVLNILELAIDKTYKDPQLETALALTLHKLGKKELEAKALETLNSNKKGVKYNNIEEAANNYLPGHEIVRTYAGHSGMVKSIDVSEDNSLMLSSGSDDMEVRLWERTSSKCLNILKGHTDWVTCVKFYPDTKYAISGSNDKTLRLWKLNTAKSVIIYRGHDDWVTCLALIPKGESMLSGSNDGTIRMWNIFNGKQIKVFKGHSAGITSLTVTTDGLYAISSSVDMKICIWNIITGKKLRELSGHTASIKTITLLPDGNHLLSGGDDKTIRLWNLKEGKEIKKFIGHTGAVIFLTQIPQKNYILSASADNTLCLWDSINGQRIKIFQNYEVNSISIINDGKEALLSMWEAVRLIDIENSYFIHFAISIPVSSSLAEEREREFQSAIDEARLVLENKKYEKVPDLIAKSRSVKGYERDREALELLGKVGEIYPKNRLVNSWQTQMLKGHNSAVTSALFDPTGLYILSGCQDGTMRLWDTETASTIREFKMHSAPITSVAFNHDGSIMASSSLDRKIILWHTQTGEIIETYHKHSDGVSKVIFSYNSSFILSSSYDGTLQLHNITTGDIDRVFKLIDTQIISCDLSPDMKYILSCGNNENVYLWDIEKENISSQFKIHNNISHCCRISNDMRYVIAGEFYEGKIHVWDLTTGKEIKTLKGHNGNINDLNVSPDGKFLISSSSDQTVRLWQLNTGLCLRTFSWHSGNINSVSFSKDGWQFLAACDDMSIRVLYLDFELEVNDLQYQYKDLERYIKIFITQHTPFMENTLMRTGQPKWSDEDYNNLINSLKLKGFGWLKPEIIDKQISTFKEEIILKEEEDNSYFNASVDTAAELFTKSRYRESLEFLNKARSFKGYERNEKALKLFEEFYNIFPRTSFSTAWKLNMFALKTSTITTMLLCAKAGLIVAGRYDNAIEVREIKDGAIVRIFKGYPCPINAIVKSDDEKSIFVSCSNKTILMQNINNGAIVRTFKGSWGIVTCLDVSPDGRFLISGNSDKTCRIWDIDSGTILRSFKGLTDRVTTVSMSPDSLYITAGSTDRTIILWDIETEQKLKLFRGHTDSVLKVKFNPDSSLLASCGEDRTVRLWDINSGKNIRTLEGHSANINTIAISADGKFILSGSDDNSVRLWNIKTGEELTSFEGLTGKVVEAAFHPEGKLAFFANHENTISTWYLEWKITLIDRTDWINEAEPFLKQFLTLHTPVVSNTLKRTGIAQWNEEDFKTLIQSLKLKGYGWLYEEGIKKNLLELQKNTVKRIQETQNNYSDLIDKVKAMIEKENYKYSLEILNRARLSQGYDSSDIEELITKLSLVFPKKSLIRARKARTIETSSEITSTAITKENQYILSAEKDNTIKVLEYKTGNKVRVLSGHKEAINSMVLFPQGCYLFSASDDCTIKFWEYTSSKCIRTFIGHTASVTSLSLSPDGLYMLSGSKDKTIQLWDIKAVEPIRTFNIHYNTVTALTYSHDGFFAFSGDASGVVYFWHIDSKKILLERKLSNVSVTALNLSQDGRVGIIGLKNGIIYILDMISGGTVFTLSSHNREITSINVSADNRYIMSSSADMTIKLWLIETGENVYTFEGHTAEINHACFNDSCLYVISGGMDKNINIWYLEWELEGKDKLNWDEGARPYLVNFIVRHIISSKGKSKQPEQIIWDEEDFEELVNELKIRGYGWLKPNGIRKKLKEIAQNWKNSDDYKNSWLSRME